MPVFLHEPRYQFAIFGFYTERLWGRRILVSACALSIIGVAATLASHFTLTNGNAKEALFLLMTAWIGVFGVIRLYFTGVMWVMTKIFDWLSYFFPGFSQFIIRFYWIMFELFLSVTFLGMLVQSILTALGIVSMEQHS